MWKRGCGGGGWGVENGGWRRGGVCGGVGGGEHGQSRVTGMD